jgi:hypothetical protein
MAEITEFNIGQGETFKVLVTLENTDEGEYVDIGDVELYGQVRENYTTDDIAAQFTITKVPPFSSGSFFIELPATTTAAFTQRKYVYDINMTHGVVSRRILEGYFVVRPASTRL